MLDAKFDNKNKAKSEPGSVTCAQMPPRTTTRPTQPCIFTVPSSANICKISANHNQITSNGPDFLRYMSHFRIFYRCKDPTSGPGDPPPKPPFSRNRGAVDVAAAFFSFGARAPM